MANAAPAIADNRNRAFLKQPPFNAAPRAADPDATPKSQ